MNTESRADSGKISVSTYLLLNLFVLSSFMLGPFPEGKSGKKRGTRCPAAFYLMVVKLVLIKVKTITSNALC